MEKRRIIETAAYPCYVGSGNAAGNNHLMRALTVEKSAEFSEIMFAGFSELV